MQNSKSTTFIFGLMTLVTILLILIIAGMWKMTSDTRDDTRQEYELFQNDLFQQSAVINKSIITLFKIINYDIASQDPTRAAASLEVHTRAAILHLSHMNDTNVRILHHLPEDDPLLLKDKISITTETLMSAAKWLTMLNQELKGSHTTAQLDHLMSIYADRATHLVTALNDNLNLQAQIQGTFFSMLKRNLANTLKRIKLLLYVLLPLFLLNIFLLLLHFNAQQRARKALETAHDDLEKRVDLRTLELKRVNQQLQNEIEERIVSESSLLRSERRFRSLLSASPVGILQATVQGDGIYFNEKLCEFTGMPAQWHNGQRWMEAAHPEDRARVEHKWRQAVTGDGDFGIEFRFKNAHGEVTWVSAKATPLLDGENRKTGFLGTLTNITDLKMADASLRDSEQKYRSMMEALRDGVYIVSSDRIITYMNPALIRQVQRDATGETCHVALFESDRICDWCVLDLVEAGKSIENEFVHPLTRQHYLVSNSPIPHADGACSKLSIFHDMTQIKHMEKRLHQAQKMESIGTLTGGIAHDFNNILGIIIGNTELALDDVPQWRPAHENLEEIRKAGLRARDIVRQLLSFSRRTGQRLEPVKIVQVIEDAVRLMRSIIPATIEMHQAFNATEEHVMANPTQINQVVINLCTNALQEMEATGGRLDIVVEAVVVEGKGHRAYRDLAPGSYIVLTVSDSGRGIGADIIDRIFEPYFSTKEVGQGAGMGLAVVHGIVDHHGGRIFVDSPAGQGTTFTVVLPQCAPVETAEPLPHQALPRGRETILLVDDETALVDMNGNRLRRLGYAVEAFTLPGEAWDRFQRQPLGYHLLITDMTMPGMTGEELARRVLALRPEMPIIICTGHSAMMDRNRAEALGIAAYLAKPVETRELAVTVRRVLGDDANHDHGARDETATRRNATL